MLTLVVYKKSTDEEESGELFKRSVKNKVTTSMGMDKQLEHNKKRKHDWGVCSTNYFWEWRIAMYITL